MRHVYVHRLSSSGPSRRAGWVGNLSQKISESDEKQKAEQRKNIWPDDAKTLFARDVYVKRLHATQSAIAVLYQRSQLFIK